MRMLALSRVRGSLARTEARVCVKAGLLGDSRSLGLGFHENRGWEEERGVLARRLWQDSTSVGCPSLHYKTHEAEILIPVSAPPMHNTFTIYKYGKKRECPE